MNNKSVCHKSLLNSIVELEKTVNRGNLEGSTIKHPNETLLCTYSVKVAHRSAGWWNHVVDEKE